MTNGTSQAPKPLAPPAIPTPPAPPVASAPSSPKKSSAAKWILIILLIIVIIIVLGLVGCWFVGKKALNTLTNQAKQVTEQVNKEITIPTGEKATNEETAKVVPEEKEKIAVPSGFPKDFPLYTGAIVESSSTFSDVMSVSLSTSDSASQVFTWYKDQAPKAGYELSGEMDTAEFKTVVITGKGYEGSVSVYTDEGKTSMVISLSQSIK